LRQGLLAFRLDSSSSLNHEVYADFPKLEPHLSSLIYKPFTGSGWQLETSGVMSPTAVFWFFSGAIKTDFDRASLSP
jgi:hypothetical protein